MDSVPQNALPTLRVTAEEGRRAPIPPGDISARLMAQGTMEVRWYTPINKASQTPHDRDELYIVVTGTAVFIRAEETTPFGEEPGIPLRGEERVAVQPGDALFVPAGTAHSFEAVSPDFATWMIFYGPEGGERNARP